MHVSLYNYKEGIIMGERVMGLKAIIAHYREMLDLGKIKKGGPAHQRLQELELKLNQL